MSLKLQRVVDKLERALIQLQDVAEEPLDKRKRNIDLTIHRFEFSFELFWKFLKVILEEQKILVSSPRKVLQEAYTTRLIDDLAKWEDMLDARNNVSHTYDESLAQTIYEDIKDTYYPLMKMQFEKLKKLTNDTPENT